MLLAALAAPAEAGLMGVPATPPPLSSAELSLVAANPLLAQLQADNPWVLRAALAGLEAPASGDAKGSLTLGPDDLALIGANPAFADMYRASPEAAADLLALIRTASGKGRK